MATISSTGVGSGLDVSSIITQLMAVERRPLNLLQTARNDLNTQLSSVGRLQSLTSAMRDAAQRLTSITLWNRTTATTSDATAVTVATGGEASAGQYAVSVQSLAAGQTLTSRAFANPGEALGAGTLTIELGAWTGADAPDDFAPKQDASPLVLTLDAADSSLEAVRDKINAAGAGVTASIINDASGARLSLRSSATGAENGFRISASEAADDGNAATGLSALAYSASGGDSQMTRYQTAANAQATINGIPVSSASNTLEDVVEGVTLKLLKTTTTDTAVEVKADDDSVKTAITGFTKAFNDLASYLREQTKYDPATKSGGALQGDRTALGLQSALRNVINQGSSASTAFERLADVGITMQADGTLAVDSTKLDGGLAKRSELRKLFATDGSTSASSGFMDRFRDMASQVLGDGGALELRSESLEAMVKRNDKGQEALEARLAQVEKRLRKQYETLDTNMARLSGLSSYVSGQLAALNRNNNG